ncbi:50S ribosomal protein L1 [Candidatus Babeliales bacterium]|nr:50S ribosomal protein L1 [Candidatus Babeliales bacterium]
MAKQGKKYTKAVGSHNRDLISSPQEGFAKIKDLAYADFDESVDVDVNLGIDPSKGDQVVRGAVVLPHGRGKAVRVIVFAKGDHAAEATEAGADHVGAEDLVQKISGGWMDFDFAVATPDLMGMVGQLAKLLGPRGLLPNKKVGTVTFKVGDVVKELKQGKLFFKNDKSGIVHFSIGKVSFDAQQLVDNYHAFMKALVASKPATSKGKFIKNVTVSSTMGVGVRLNPDEAVKL